MKRIIFILLLLTTLNIYSETDPKIYLTTIGPGDDLFLRWGHFAVVVDYENKRDHLYDYGNFSIDEDNFIPNFVKGVMTYFKYRKSANNELDAYKKENRTITLQELNLTQDQVNFYLKKLQKEIQPENMFYQYDHYYNNCVSQISDFLDELTEGQFYKGTSKLAGRSFRDLSRDYVSSNYLYNNLIMFVLGSKVDYNVSIKESLFLPEYTRDWADKVTIPDSNNSFKPLIKKRFSINESIDREPVIKDSKPKILLNLLVGIFIALVSLIINRFNKFSAFINILMGFILGFLGSTLFFMAFFTGHYYIHNNWNLIMVNPLVFILIIGGILKFSKRFYTAGFKIITTHADITLLATVIMLLLKSIGLINQGNGEIISLIAPTLMVNSSFILLIFDYPGRSKRFSSKPGNLDEASNNNSLEESTTVELSSK